MIPLISKSQIYPIIDKLNPNSFPHDESVSRLKYYGLTENDN